MHYDYDAIIAVSVDSPAPNPSDPCQDWKKADIDLSAEDTAYVCSRDSREKAMTAGTR